MKINVRKDILQIIPVKVTEIKEQSGLILPDAKIHVSSPIRFYKVISDGEMKNKYIMLYSSRVYEAKTVFSTYYFAEKDGVIADIEFDKKKYTIEEIKE